MITSRFGACSRCSRPAYWASVPRQTRFPAADPSKAENFYAGASPAGMNVDSQGNVWITTRFGNGLTGKLHLADMGCPCEIWRCRARHGLPQLTFGK
jgi:hypothetical protein